MGRKTLFLISLLAIFLISWANVDYFGSSLQNRFSPVVNQSVHFAALIITYVLGYLNWRDREKWLLWLWKVMYIVVIIAFVLMSSTYYVSGVKLYKLVASILRNSFTSPLPFLVFYLFDRFSAQFKNQDNGKP